MENEELLELKELSIAKIKVAYNRSIDVEATHMILWSKSEKNKKNKLLIMLIFSFIAASSLIFTLFSNLFSEFRTYIVFTDIFAILVLLIIIWDTIQEFTGRNIDHGHMVNDALQLREQSLSFLQYKLDNLDRQGYIDELVLLETKDSVLKEKSSKYTQKLSDSIQYKINQKLENLKIQGIKKYFITPEEIDSATQKLKKFSDDVWIKFE